MISDKELEMEFTNSLPVYLHQMFLFCVTLCQKILLSAFKGGLSFAVITYSNLSSPLLCYCLYCLLEEGSLNVAILGCSFRSVLILVLLKRCP